MLLPEKSLHDEVNAYDDEEKEESERSRKRPLVFGSTPSTQSMSVMSKSSGASTSSSLDNALT